MNDKAQYRLPQVEEALETLARAVVRLEGAAQRSIRERQALETEKAQRDADGGAVGAGAVDPAIGQELESLRADYDNLKTVSRAVSGRLDGAIERLRTTLER